MKKGYLYELATPIVLLAVIEAYFWTQGRTWTFDDLTTKAFLIGLYGVLAVASQAVVSSSPGFGAADALKANLLTAAAISLGLTLLAFFVHPAVLKDVARDWLGAVGATLRFFVTVGLATVLLRMLVAITWAWPRNGRR